MSSGRPDAEFREVLQSLLDAMPERHRLPMWLCYCQGFGVDETAEVLSQKEDEVKDMLANGLSDLQQRLRSRHIPADPVSLTSMLTGLAPARAPDAVIDGIRAILHGAPEPRMGAARPGRGAKSDFAGSARSCRYAHHRPDVPDPDSAARVHYFRELGIWKLPSVGYN